MTSVLAAGTVTAWASVLAYEDLRFRRLPNRWLLIGVCLGAIHYVGKGIMPLGASLSDGLLASALAALFFLPFYAAGWMGAGDVKFSTVIGGLAGVSLLVKTIILSWLFAGGMALLLLGLDRGALWQIRRFFPAAADLRIPYGTCLAAALVYLTWCEKSLSLPFLPSGA